MINKNLRYNNPYVYYDVRFAAAKRQFAIDNAYKQIDIKSADYIKYCYKLVKSWCRRPIEINVESGRLLDIADSDEPNIFIMNHTMQQRKDVNAAKFFNNLLYREYLYHDKASVCPRTKVLAASGVFKKQPDEGALYRWMGVTPIYTGLNKSYKEKNASTIKNLIEQLANKEINLFLFPEGIFGFLTFIPLRYKFQPGVSSIIKKVLELTDKINVIPLGMAHSHKLSSVHIGEKVCFSKENNQYYFTKNNQSTLITEEGKPVNYDNSVPYFSGILVKSLQSAINNSKEDLKNSCGNTYLL